MPVLHVFIVVVVRKEETAETCLDSFYCLTSTSADP
jgi:hypothetical protein